MGGENAGANEPQNSTGIDIFIPFAEKLGVRALHQRDGEAILELVLREEHMNSWQMAHGGVVMTVLDIVMGMSAKSLDPASSGAATIELKTNFIQPATGRIIGRGLAQRQGRSLVFVEGELRNDAQELLARATGTFKLRYLRTEEK